MKYESSHKKKKHVRVKVKKLTHNNPPKNHASTNKLFCLEEVSSLEISEVKKILIHVRQEVSLYKKISQL